MPMYIMFSKLTEEGRRTVKKNPDRIREVDKEIEKMGAKVLAQYAVLGKYDFINILEAPNNEAIARVSIDLGSRGTVQIVTMPAIPVYEFIEKMEVYDREAKESSEPDIPDAYQEKMQGS